MSVARTSFSAGVSGPGDSGDHLRQPPSVKFSGYEVSQIPSDNLPAASVQEPGRSCRQRLSDLASRVANRIVDFFLSPGERPRGKLYSVNFSGYEASVKFSGYEVSQIPSDNLPAASVQGPGRSCRQRLSDLASRVANRIVDFFLSPGERPRGKL